MIGAGFVYKALFSKLGRVPVRYCSASRPLHASAAHLPEIRADIGHRAPVALMVAGAVVSLSEK